MKLLNEWNQVQKRRKEVNLIFSNPHSPFFIISKRSKSTLFITGKVDKKYQLLSFINNNKKKLIAGTTLVSLLYFFGLKNIIKWTVGTICILGAIIFVIYKSSQWISPKIPVHKTVIEELFKNRSNIENIIGSFENPTLTDLMADFVTENGIPVMVLRFQLQGTRGHAIGNIRAHVTDSFDEKFYTYRKQSILEKFRLDMISIDQPDYPTALLLVDKSPPNPFSPLTVTVLSDVTADTKSDLKG